MRYAILVDAGYFYAALATRMTGSSNRAAVNVDEESLIHRLMDQAQAECGAEPLRVLWYDGGTNGMPDIHQRRIGNFDGVKLRMGRMNSYGEQKGVDLRLGLDLVLMAVYHTVEFAYVRMWIEFCSQISPTPVTSITCRSGRARSCATSFGPAWTK